MGPRGQGLAREPLGDALHGVDARHLIGSDVHPRGRAVIEKAAQMAGWKPDQKGDGRNGRGIGFAKYKNLACYVAVVAEVEVDREKGTICVCRAFCATDAGLVINPDGLINQIEGGIIQGTSWTLHEEVKFAPSGILSRTPFS